MILAAVLTAVLALVTAGAQGQSVTIAGPDTAEVLEGESYTISWEAEGLHTVTVVAYGVRTPLGDTSRGAFEIPIADSIPVEMGEARWTVPWIDSLVLFVEIRGYDSSGSEVAHDQRDYNFRPRSMAKRTHDGIYLDLRAKTNQRLYVQRGGVLTHVYLSSSSGHYRWSPRNSHPKGPHDHAGVFRVLSKTPMHWSRMYQVPMPWAMRYHTGHFIHATSSDNYQWLGQPSSSGCNRITEVDARELYQMTPLGTRVEVIGPGG